MLLLWRLRQGWGRKAIGPPCESTCMHSVTCQLSCWPFPGKCVASGTQSVQRANTPCSSIPFLKMIKSSSDCVLHTTNVSCETVCSLQGEIMMPDDDDDDELAAPALDGTCQYLLHHKFLLWSAAASPSSQYVCATVDSYNLLLMRFPGLRYYF